MNVEQARFNMIEQQIRPWEVLNQDVLDLLFVIKRENFVPPAHRALAFADMELPLGHGQFMLAPRLEARLLQELAVKNSDRVLEIGTGSGYMAALLAAQAKHVISIERLADLATVAQQNLAQASIDNVTVEIGDGTQGWAQNAPYDVILVSGALPTLPHELLAQLAPGGRLIAIIGQAPAMSVQLITRSDDAAFTTVTLFETVVPVLQGMSAGSTFSF